MDNTCELPTEKGGETGEPDELTPAPDPTATFTDRIPDSSQDTSVLTAVERKDSSSPTPTAKKRKKKTGTKEKKEKKQKAKMKQLNLYEMYHWSAFPLAAIKRLIQRHLEKCHYNNPNI
ncbi:unnamed protein product [Nyctereutes procyonoides]|uniref:(raccoon dog) hypothetical protein n=1 Tax=Nyctereutes procyonoides TaxID=34880 RepID=A0A811ZFY4_NYCPR|nr:unnamed protein product [Nyctereutes procyonoides]